MSDKEIFEYDNNDENINNSKQPNKSIEEYKTIIEADYLLGISTLISDFKNNIEFYIDQRKTGTTKEKKEASDILLGLLFTSSKDPKQIQFPALDIEDFLSKANEK